MQYKTRLPDASEPVTKGVVMQGPALLLVALEPETNSLFETVTSGSIIHTGSPAVVAPEFSPLLSPTYNLSSGPTKHLYGA